MKLRVSAVQYHLHTISSFTEFENQVEHYVKTAEEFGTKSYSSQNSSPPNSCPSVTPTAMP